MLPRDNICQHLLIKYWSNPCSVCWLHSSHTAVTSQTPHGVCFPSNTSRIIHGAAHMQDNMVMTGLTGSTCSTENVTVKLAGTITINAEIHDYCLVTRQTTDTDRQPHHMLVHRFSTCHLVRVVVSVSTSQSRDVPTSLLEKNCQRLGLVSVSAIYVLCLRPCINSFLMGMQMAPYAVWTGFRRCKRIL